ncbi:hypothetical protein, partial [uncultured Desulfovibrio sp.]|uniref:hypothetical protein n=1 Tax=uncultured Desulfovibrio sp. TaxID=167968 RepID=UPI002621A4A9
EGKPLISAVDARSFLRRNGHGLRPPSVAAGARGFSLPPKPPIPSPGAFIGEESGIRDGFATKDKWRVYSLFILSIELFVKFVLTGPGAFSV